MQLRKSREQRDAERAEVDRQDREHAARLAALNDVTRQGPMFCQSCRAKLRPNAVRCHYCGGTDLARNDPSAPLFSQAAVGGACAKCGGRSFTAAGVGTGTAIEVGFLVAGVVGAAVGAAASMDSGEYVLCVTCGARYRRG
jgi:hypothetical protein